MSRRSASSGELALRELKRARELRELFAGELHKRRRGRCVERAVRQERDQPALGLEVLDGRDQPKELREGPERCALVRRGLGRPASGFCLQNG